MKTNYLITNVFYDRNTHKKSVCGSISRVRKLGLIDYANNFCYNYLFGRYA
jgi:hypothetical protein